MPGYANRTIYLGFPDLTEDGDVEVHVIIKNPKTVPLPELTPAGVKEFAEGDVDVDAAFPAMNKVMAGLVKAWHVYDATSMDDDQPPLPLPATAESLAKLPHDITSAIMERITEAMAPKEAQTTRT